MPKIMKGPRTAGLKGLGTSQPAKAVFDPAKLKGAKGPATGKHLVQGGKRLLVPGKGRAR